MTATTARCVQNRWGDPNGHIARHEPLCPRCAALANAKVRRWSFLTGRTNGIRLTRDELLVFVREFNTAWNPETRDPDTALAAAVEAAVRHSVDRTERTPA